MKKIKPGLFIGVVEEAMVLSRGKLLWLVSTTSIVAVFLYTQIAVHKRVSKYFDDSEALKMSLTTSHNHWAEEERSKTMQKKCSEAVDKLVDCECAHGE